MNKKDTKNRIAVLLLLCGVLAFIAFTAGYFVGRHSSHGSVTIYPGVSVTTQKENNDIQNTPDISDNSLLIDLNTATAAELDTLPGIGPVIAERIIEYRETNGAFETTSQIMNVNGIGTETYLEIKDLITIN